MIVKIYNRKRDTNRLVGYIKVTEHDFTKTFSKDFSKTHVNPNDVFYRKFRKAFNMHWQPHFAWKKLSDKEVAEIIESYKRKVEFYSKQQNVLETLSSL